MLLQKALRLKNRVSTGLQPSASLLELQSAFLTDEVDSVESAAFPFLAVCSRLRKEDMRETFLMDPIPRNNSAGFRLVNGARQTGGAGKRRMLRGREPGGFAIESSLQGCDHRNRIDHMP